MEKDTTSKIIGADPEATPDDAIPPGEEKKIRRTLDLRMMPLVCLFYFTDFLDRANIGNAKLIGIQKDLDLTPTQMSVAISMFYISYIIFEVPSNIVLKRTNAAIWLSTIMLLWGTITLITAFVRNFASLVAVRFFLGVAEAGYIPGILYQISRVYKPNEVGVRFSCIFCMGFLSGVISGPIAYGTALLEGRAGLHGWQFLFIFLGVPTILLSFLSYWCLFDDINSVGWLSADQKRWQAIRMRSLDKQKDPDDDSMKGSGNNVRWKDIKAALIDWKTWVFVICYFMNAANMTSISVFSPTLIDGFGFSVLNSQLLSSPPNLLAAFVVILGGRLADIYGCQPLWIALGFMLISIGNLLLLVLQDPWALYGSLFVITSGIAIQISSIVSWASKHYSNETRRAVGLATVVGIGNSGSVVASYLFPSNERPSYTTGKSVNLGLAACGIIVTSAACLIIHRQQKRIPHTQV